MVAAGSFIEDFDYIELVNNYDKIYETLISGGVVWIHLNYNQTDAIWPEMTGQDGYLRFMVTAWRIADGLYIVCPEGSLLRFPNGSYNPSAPE